MTVSELIRTKRAVRQFTDEPLSEEAIRSILNAGRRAQSSKNTQPWHFIAIRDRETLRQLSQCGAYAGHLAGAPFAVALISSTDEGFDLGQARSLYATGCLGPGHWLMHRFNVGTLSGGQVTGEGQSDPGGSAGPSL